MTAETQVLDNIDKAWSLATSSVDQATDFATNAVNIAQGYITTGGFKQVGLELPDANGVTDDVNSKIGDIEASVDKTMTRTVPDAYKKLFKDLINQGGNVTTAFGTGTANASDSMALVHGMSSAFNSLNFTANTNSLASFLSTGMLTGGTSNAPYGLPAIIENAIRDRMIGKIDEEAIQAEEEASASYAARGFPLPPGMMAKRFSEVQDKAQAEKSSAIKDVAIDQAKRGFEAGQNYVQQFQTLQGQTASAFNSYLGTVVSARAGASDDVKALVTSVADLQKSIVSLYAYAMDERKVLLQQAVAEGQLNNEFLGLEIDSFNKHIEASAGTTIAAAQAMGAMAASAVSSQNSMSRISADTITKGT